MAGKTPTARQAGGSTRRTGRGGTTRKKRHLTPRELREFERLLVAKKRTLLGDVALIRDEFERDGPGRAGEGDPDFSVGSAAIETDAELLDREVALLREIDDALERIGDGTYGYCVATGRPIPKARLRAMPWARYSTEYARAMEQAAARRAGPGGSPSRGWRP